MHGGLIVGPLVGAYSRTELAAAHLEGARHRGAVDGARAGHRSLGELLQRGSVRAADRSAVEALHLARSIARSDTPSSSTSTRRSCTSRCGTWRFFLVLVECCARGCTTRPGALFFAYVGLYSIGRFAIEALRLDSFWLGSVRVPQLASLIGVASSRSRAWPGRTAAPAHRPPPPEHRSARCRPSRGLGPRSAEARF